jgi:hypothetical protein
MAKQIQLKVLTYQFRKLDVAIYGKCHIELYLFGPLTIYT